ncbi:MAG: hypothetical protein WC180_02660 [Candidatus Paceibacterota bacterium]
MKNEEEETLSPDSDTKDEVKPEELSGAEEEKEKASETNENLPETMSAISSEPDTAMAVESNFLLAPEEKPKSFMVIHGRWALIVFFHIVVLSVACVAYLSCQKPESQIVDNTSQEDSRDVIIKASRKTMNGAKGFDFDGKMEFSFDDKEDASINGYEKEESRSYSMMGKGVVDVSDWRSPALYSAAVIERNKGYSMGTNDILKENTVLTTEMTYFDGTLYLKPDKVHLEGVVGEEEMSMVNRFWNVVKHNWCFISQKGTEEFLGGIPGNISPFDSKFSPDNIFKISGLISSDDFLKFDSDLGDDKVGETDTYHYRMKLDEAAGYDLILELLEVDIRGEEEKNAFKKEVRENSDKADKTKEFADMILDKINAEIWIGKDNNFVYRIKIDGDFDEFSMEVLRDKYDSINEGGYIPDDREATDRVLNFALDYTFSNFNNTSVQKPEDAKDLQKIIELFQVQAMSGISAKNPDTDGDGLSDKQEEIFGSDANRPDTDGDGYNDGAEIDKGFDPIVAGETKLDYEKLYDSLSESAQ